MKSDEELLIYKFSHGENLAVVPIGFKERVLCLLKNEAQIEEILRIWRSGEIWAIIKIKLLQYSHTSILEKGETITFVNKRIPGSPSQQKVLWMQGAGIAVRDYGYIVGEKRYLLHLPKEKFIPIIPTLKDKKAAIPLRWEILPPGWWRTSPQFYHAQVSKQRLCYTEIERLELLGDLNPEKWYAGTNCLGERIYSVAIFKTCVVAESPTYGNAAYFVFDINNWQTILSQTKREVLQLPARNILKVSHTRNWRSIITKIITRA